MNPDIYYNRKEVSNSDLTALKEILYPRPVFGDRDAAFRFGSLVDAVVTEPERVNYYLHTVDGEPYEQWEFDKAYSMLASLKSEAERDPFLAQVLANSDTQKVMVNKAQEFDIDGFKFHLNTRCKWDWWLPTNNFGGDLKTMAAGTQREFDDAIDHFDWDRSRAWYMDIARSDFDFIYAISKKNHRVFKKMIRRGDEIYNRGKEKYLSLAFQWWMLTPPEL